MGNPASTARRGSAASRKSLRNFSITSVADEPPDGGVGHVPVQIAASMCKLPLKSRSSGSKNKLSLTVSKFAKLAAATALNPARHLLLAPNLKGQVKFVLSAKP